MTIFVVSLYKEVLLEEIIEYSLQVFYSYTNILSVFMKNIHCLKRQIDERHNLYDIQQIPKTKEKK